MPHVHCILLNDINSVHCGASSWPYSMLFYTDLEQKLSLLVYWWNFSLLHFDENYYSGVVCSNVMVSASLYNTNCICYLFIVKIAVVWNNCTHSEGKLYGVFPCKAAIVCMRYACIQKYNWNILTPVCMVYFIIQPPAILFCVHSC